MWISSFGEYQFMWEEGKVKHSIVDPVTKNIIMYKPRALQFVLLIGAAGLPLFLVRAFPGLQDWVHP
jgi:hypothetical protein